jgi:hypothetical protein
MIVIYISPLHQSLYIESRVAQGHSLWGYLFLAKTSCLLLSQLWLMIFNYHQVTN